MKIDGVIESIHAHGYDRLLGVRTEDGMVFCSYLQLDEYLDADRASTHLSVGAPICLSAKLLFVLRHSAVDASIPASLRQAQAGTPSTTVVGDVLCRLDSDSYTLSAGKGRRIDVEFEDDVDLDVGSRIQVNGELRGEALPQAD